MVLNSYKCGYQVQWKVHDKWQQWKFEKSANIAINSQKEKILLRKGLILPYGIAVSGKYKKCSLLTRYTF